MATQQKTVEAGQLTKIVTFTRPRRNAQPKTRAAKAKESDEKTRNNNAKHSRETLEELLYCNFTSADYYITLTYDDLHALHKWKYLSADIKYFWKRLRYYRRKRGEELRYIYVVEGFHGDARPHVHAIVNATATGSIMDDLESTWHGGMIKDVKKLEMENLGALATYLSKEFNRDQQERGKEFRGINSFHPSRNCKRPAVKTTTLNSHAAPFAPPGSVIIETKSSRDANGERFNYLKFLRPEGQPSGTDQ